jgi:hypothetical protein
MLVVSGYVQPMFRTTANINVGKYLFTLADSYTGKDTSVYLYFSGTHLTAYLHSDGVLYPGTIITNYKAGDTLFVAMYIGWTSGTYTLGYKLRVVGDDTTYSVEDNTSTDKFTIYDTLYIGTDESGVNNQADTVFQDVNIWAGTEAQVATQVEYMTDEDNLMEHRETLGRLYHVKSKLSPSPWNRQRYSGDIECENIEAI